MTIDLTRDFAEKIVVVICRITSISKSKNPLSRHKE